MKIIKRKTPAPLLWSVRSTFHFLMKSTLAPALEGNFEPVRKVFDTYGSMGLFGVKTKDEIITGFKSRWFTPKKVKDDTIIMYCHGGGYCAGSINSHKHMGCLFAKQLQRELVMFNYRLSPEHAYPAQIDDGIQFYLELLKKRSANKIVLMGDSAGGAMVLALAQRIRDQNIDPAKGIVAICPWYDFEVDLAKQSDIEDPGLPVEMVECYAAHAFQESSQKQHSLKYTQFENLPPINLIMGGADTIHAEDCELAAGLEKANPNCEIESWNDMPHVWHSLHPFIAEAKASAKDIAKFVDQL